MEVINCDELFNTISNLTPTEYNNKYNELINIYPNNKDKIDWECLMCNPAIFTYDYEKIKEIKSHSHLTSKITSNYPLYTIKK